MLTYILRRVLYSIPVLILSTFLSFIFISYAGNPVALLRQTPRFNKATIAHEIIQQHLNLPVIERYFLWVRDVFEHKFGTSLQPLQPLWPDISRFFGHTMQFIIVAELLAMFVGVAVGIYSAIRQYSVFDYTFTSVSFLGFAMPTFWLALLLQILFTDIYLHWNVRIFYPSGLNNDLNGSAWSLDRLQHIVLPVATLCIISFAGYSRYMRASMLDVINSDYVRTARAKGLRENRVLTGHAVRNALIPVVTIIALQIPGIFGGAVVTEQIFRVPGTGNLLIQAITNKDTPVIMAVTFIFAVLVVVCNLLADVIYGLLDPRIKYS